MGEGLSCDWRDVEVRAWWACKGMVQQRAMVSSPWTWLGLMQQPNQKAARDLGDASFGAAQEENERNRHLASV